MRNQLRLPLSLALFLAACGGETAPPAETHASDTGGREVGGGDTIDAIPDGAADVEVGGDAANAAPVASAGEDVSGRTGAAIQLDGRGSLDPDGDPLTFTWEVTDPADGALTLSDPSSALPTATGTRAGTWTVTLTVSDPQGLESTDSVVVTVFENAAPVADAGADLLATVGAEVALDGSGSTDPDGDPLTFAWTIVEAPDGSTAALDDAASAQPRLTPDLEGDYVAELVVSDGALTSAPDRVTVTATVVSANNRPLAAFSLLGPYRLGSTVLLDASTSRDPDGDPLTFQWTVSTAPTGSSASVADATSVATTLVPDAVGSWAVTLVVNDGEIDSAPITVPFEVTEFGRAPVADAGPDQSVEPGSTVELDGGDSFDPDGDALTWAWTFSARPAGSAAALDDPSSPTPTFVADVAGSYLVELVVSDGGLDSPADSVRIDAVSPPCLIFSEYIEGSASNKAIEIFNCGGAIDLTGVSVCVAANASTSCSITVPLEGRLEAGAVHTVCNASASLFPDGACAQRSGSLSFNGNDRLAVYRNVGGDPGFQRDTDELFDAFGQIEVAPDAEIWEEVTYRRCDPTPFAGDSAFDVAALWLAFEADDVSGLGVAPTFTGGCVVETNERPIAAAGPDVVVSLGDVVSLDGTASSDPDDDVLTYAWTVLGRPVGSSAAPAAPTEATTTFTPDATGLWTIQLTVSDGELDDTDTRFVTVEAANRAPVAAINATPSVRAGEVLVLDGSASGDPDGDAITWAWRIAARPAGATAELVADDAETVSVTPDLAGMWEFELTVSDGVLSDAATVRVEVLAPNRAPTARAGDDRSAEVGAPVSLDGSASDDPDGDSIAFSWAFTSRPPGSTVALIDADSASPSFTPDLAGVYSVRLTVSDGELEASDSLLVTATRPNSVPVGAIDAPARTLAGAWVELDGAGSADADGDALEFEWSLASRPGTSAATLDVLGVGGGFRADVAGTYRIELVVNDGRAASATAVAEIVAVAPSCVRISEVISGSSNNKAVEVQNCGSEELPLEPLKLCLVSNAATTCTSAINVSGTLAPDTVVTYCNSSANPAVLDPASCTVATGSVSFNGDDRLVLFVDGNGENGYDAADDTLLDAFGEIAVRPASLVWANRTLRRCGAAAHDGGRFDLPRFFEDAGADDFSNLGVASSLAGCAPIVDNRAPVADAGMDRSTSVFAGVALDATGSFDPDDDELTYFWSLLVGPPGAVARFSDERSATPVFDANLAGSYTLELRVSDGDLEDTDEVVVDVVSTNAPPVADAGADLRVLRGGRVLLDGSDSSDAEGSPLSWRWRVASAPTGAAAALESTDSAVTALAPDVAGTWTVELVVNDGTADSAADTVAIEVVAESCFVISQVVDGSASNKAIELHNCGEAAIPLGSARVCVVANANTTCTGSVVLPDAELAAGATFSLCGSASSDPPVDLDVCDILSGSVSFNGNDRIVLFVNGDAAGGLNVAVDRVVDAFGEIATQPEGTPWLDRNLGRCTREAFLGEVDWLVEDFFVDGDFDDFAGLGVQPAYDGCPGANTPPVAVLDAPETGAVGTLVVLDGAGSFDPDGDLLDYEWTLIDAPDGAVADLDATTGASVGFTPDAAGLWVVELAVRDGRGGTDSVTAEIAVAVTAVADPGSDRDVVAGAWLRLDGSASSTTTGAALEYTWRFVERPAGSAASLDSDVSATPSFVADLAGTYIVELVVDDGTAESLPASVTVRAVAADCLLLSELIDGSSQNKAIEVHNCGTAAVPLEGLSVCVVANADTSCTSAMRSQTGTIAAGGVRTYCNTAAAPPALDPATCDVTSGQVAFNGNDRVLIFVNGDEVAGFGGDDVLLDAFGDPEVVPVGSPWADFGYSRCSDEPYLGGGEFDPASRYRTGTFDDFSGLGIAPTYDDCGLAPENRAPTADAGDDITATLGVPVALDGTGSSDPDAGDTLTFAWTITGRPDGAAASLVGADSATPSIEPDLVGTWVFSLTVTDAAGLADTDTVQVVVRESGGGPACLRISEVVEGSSFNKVVEVHNCGADSVDLSGFAICLVSNAATSCSTSLALGGSLEADGVIVICDSGLNTALLPEGVTCDFTSGVAWFNGDDRLALYANGEGGVTAFEPGTDVMLDQFGRIESQPSSRLWENATFRRCNPAAFLGGVDFDVAAFFTRHALDDFSDVGTAPAYDGCAG
jgi:predicted extracellular nuclease